MARAQRAEEGGVGGVGARGWGGGGGRGPAQAPRRTPPLRAAQPFALSPGGGRLNLRPLPSPSQDGKTALDEVKAKAVEARATAARQAAAAARQLDELDRLAGLLEGL